jgi:hypothetical protein
VDVWHFSFQKVIACLERLVADRFAELIADLERQSRPDVCRLPMVCDQDIEPDLEVREPVDVYCADAVLLRNPAGVVDWEVKID